MDVSVVIATFGDPHWQQLAKRAAASVPASIPVHQVHAATLHDARNRGLAATQTEWVCHLDADDELDPGYFDHMAAATGDVRVPSVVYVQRGRPHPPMMPTVWGHRHACTADCLPEGNWIVVGAVARTQLVRDVGGWRDFTWSEDWDVWLRCHLAGAAIEPVPAARYRAYVRADSRNRAPDQAAKTAAHQAIYRANFPDQAVA